MTSQKKEIIQNLEKLTKELDLISWKYKWREAQKFLFLFGRDILLWNCFEEL